MERTDHQISVRVTPAFISLYTLAASLFSFSSAGKKGPAPPSPPRAANKTLPEYLAAEGGRLAGMFSSCNLARQRRSRGGWKMSSRLPLRSQPGQQRLSPPFSGLHECKHHHACTRTPAGLLRAGGARAGAPIPAPVRSVQAGPGGAGTRQDRSRAREMDVY